jgi:hypothetical protein
MIVSPFIIKDYLPIHYQELSPLPWSDLDF